VYAQDAVVGDGDPMSIPAEVFEDRQACFKWSFAIDIPVFGIEHVGDGTPNAIVLQPPYFMPHFL